jgi:hypothetical protein
MEAIVPLASSHLCFATSTSKDGVYTFSYFLTFYGNKVCKIMEAKVP